MTPLCEKPELRGIGRADLAKRSALGARDGWYMQQGQKARKIQPRLFPVEKTMEQQLAIPLSEFRTPTGQGVAGQKRLSFQEVEKRKRGRPEYLQPPI